VTYVLAIEYTYIDNEDGSQPKREIGNVFRYYKDAEEYLLARGFELWLEPDEDSIEGSYLKRRENDSDITATLRKRQLIFNNRQSVGGLK
jgi:hypothetical protein